MTETQERFLRTVLSRVPLDSVVELHLFPPIRRGTLETGVAVIATVLPPAPVALLMEADTEEATAVSSELTPDDDSPYRDEVEDEPTAADAAAADDAPESLAAAADDAPGSHVVVDAVEASDADHDADHDAVVTHDAVVNDDAVADDESSSHEEEAVINAGALHDEAVTEDESSSNDEEAVIDAGALNDNGEEIDAAASVMIPSPRMRILTAAYRHTIKGIDRGKWSVDVQEEADAPLDAVEAVLRGVRHRSTEPADPEQVSHDALAALVTPSIVAPAAA
jgi:hypothetical protein